MKILISADIEGTAGIIHDNQVTPPDQAGTSSPDYEWARGLMVEEVNAAIQGAFAGGATEVLVNDSHDGMRNLVPEQLDQRAKLINGSNKPLSMLQGINLGVDAVICTGYHAARNTMGAVLAHTYSSPVRELSLNGMVVGELGLSAALAGHFGVPIIMVTGDDKCIAEARNLLGDPVVGVAVKTGISETAAIHFHPFEARKMILAGAKQAVSLIERIPPLTLRTPIELEIDFPKATQADFAELLPQARRVNSTRVAYNAPDMLVAFRAFLVLIKLATGNV
jgi:D-amino peptidase